MGSSEPLFVFDFVTVKTQVEEEGEGEDASRGKRRIKDLIKDAHCSRRRRLGVTKMTSASFLSAPSLFACSQVVCFAKQHNETLELLPSERDAPVQSQGMC